eukprot:4113201-Pyramimonas_sp.AAC.1
MARRDRIAPRASPTARSRTDQAPSESPHGLPHPFHQLAKCEWDIIRLHLADSQGLDVAPKRMGRVSPLSGASR